MTSSLPSASVRVNGDRLWQSLMRLAAIGATQKGGVCRLALTEADGAGRDLFVQWAKEIGCAIRVDRIGNIFARRPGTDPARLPILTGSHLDTQPTGGKFDGAYGVMAGLEVLRTLDDLKIPTAAPIEVAVWTNEEGSRFIPVMMGSGVFTGAFDLDPTLDQTGRDGTRVGDALKAIGYAGTEDPRAHAVGMYFEAHIEQGPVLESEATLIGVVTGAMGQRWYDIEVQGMEAHAGPTPMAIRQDALVASAGIVEAVNRIAIEQTPHGRGTVGCLDVFPNSRNVIPGRVRLTVDFRNALDSGLARMDQELRRACAEAERPGVSVRVTEVVHFAPQDFSRPQIDSVRDAANALGYSNLDLASGAAHDAVYLARVAPTAMIFVPCKDGISHNEIEYAAPEHLEAGANVLLHAMLSQANAERIYQP
jgi:N-carbamoyl-L-amino-acid hydrolase